VQEKGEIVEWRKEVAVLWREKETYTLKLRKAKISVF